MSLKIFPLLLFILSIIGIILNRSNVLFIFIFIEILFISIIINLMIISLFHESIINQLYSLYIITIAAIETSIGLSILISFYKLKGSISIRLLNLLKG
uniref:NADH dehydrogenase subunit 4L n=1 Tax=Craseoa lathetica TaxID=316205 RepID=UPI0026E491B5|nr:NADH dehydrogenase subunit 4L [Craseoa lathetica]WJJ70144.1 NADH dehydrogenase subunit 4L [Craseoa lathetica]